MVEHSEGDVVVFLDRGDGVQHDQQQQRKRRQSQQTPLRWHLSSLLVARPSPTKCALSRVDAGNKPTARPPRVTADTQMYTGDGLVDQMQLSSGAFSKGDNRLALWSDLFVRVKSQRCSMRVLYACDALRLTTRARNRMQERKMILLVLHSSQSCFRTFLLRLVCCSRSTRHVLH